MGGRQYRDLLSLPSSLVSKLGTYALPIMFVERIGPTKQLLINVTTLGLILLGVGGILMPEQLITADDPFERLIKS